MQALAQSLPPHWPSVSTTITCQSSAGTFSIIALTSPGTGALDARVEVKEALGGESYLYATLDGGDRIVIKTDGDDPTRGGDVVGLVLPPERIHLFAADGANLTVQP